MRKYLENYGITTVIIIVVIVLCIIAHPVGMAIEGATTNMVDGFATQVVNATEEIKVGDNNSIGGLPEEQVNLTYVLVDGPTLNQKLKAVDSANKIKSINITTTQMPNSAKEIADVDADSDKGIVGWYTINPDNTSTVYISSQKAGQKVIAPVNSSRMFQEFPELLEVNLNGNLDTSNTINMEKMFYYNSKMVKTDVNTMDVSKVENMYRLFAYCNALPSIDVSTWNTSSLINAGSIFFYCENLTHLDLKHFDMSKAQKMSTLFQNCYKLSYLDVSGWDTSKNTTLSTTFQNTGRDVDNLVVKGFENWDTSNVKDSKYTFFGFGAHTKQKMELDLSKWDYHLVTGMEAMFNDANIHTIKTPKNIQRGVRLTSDRGTTITDKKWYDITDGNKAYNPGEFPTGTTNSHLLSLTIE